MMRSLLIAAGAAVLLSFVFSPAGLCQTHKKDIDMKLAFVELDKDKVKADVKGVYEEARKQLKAEKSYPTRFGAIAGKLDVYCKHPFVESETGIERKWFQQLHYMVTQMGKIMGARKLAQMNGERVAYSKYSGQCQAILDAYEKLGKKPAKISRSKLKELRKRHEEEKDKLRKKIEEAEKRLQQG